MKHCLMNRVLISNYSHCTAARISYLEILMLAKKKSLVTMISVTFRAFIFEAIYERLSCEYDIMISRIGCGLTQSVSIKVTMQRNLSRLAG